MASSSVQEGHTAPTWPTRERLSCDLQFDTQAISIFIIDQEEPEAGTERVPRSMSDQSECPSELIGRRHMKRPLLHSSPFDHVIWTKYLTGRTAPGPAVCAGSDRFSY